MNNQLQNFYGQQIKYNKEKNDVQSFSNGSNYPFAQTSEQISLGLSTQYTSSNKYNSKIKLISRGIGLNEKEFDIIIESCIEIQDSKAALPLSIKCITKIKEQIGGEWFVFACPETEKNYDFYLSYTENQKFCIFKYSGNEYHVCNIN